ncbi:MAG: serine/threonine-protein kinase [bacterium]
MTIETGLVLADRFRIEKPIGSGGVGLVYRAFDLQQNIPVAVKCLRAEWAEHLRIRRRFMREARAISRLNHPNIVRVFDYGEDPSGAPYIAMEYLDGTPLSEMREQTMPVPVLLELFDQVLGALAYIHARRVIHRDVKPENVIIQSDGHQATAKLLDFGFARVEEDQDARLSQTRMETFGTPTYMAPEQATGKGVIGPPTDIYALGVMLYEFLAGQPPFTGTHGMAIALKHLMEPVPPLRARPGLHLPPGLEAVVGRMLKKAPADRYATAPDVRRALQPFRVGPGEVEDEDATLQTPLADAAAAIARIAGEMAQTVKAEQSGLFRPLASVGPIAVEAPIGRGGDAAPLVGREADLVEMWSRVRRVCETSEGKAILLGAEPGMGRRDVVGGSKSRWPRAAGCGSSAPRPGPPPAWAAAACRRCSRGSSRGCPRPVTRPRPTSGTCCCGGRARRTRPPPARPSRGPSPGTCAPRARAASARPSSSGGPARPSAWPAATAPCCSPSWPLIRPISRPRPSSGTWPDRWPTAASAC